MNYKESARSPHYGRIYGYDESGKEMKELDVLKLKVVAKSGKLYTVAALLKKVLELESVIDKMYEDVNKNTEMQKQVEILTQLVIVLDAKIKLLEVNK